MISRKVPVKILKGAAAAALITMAVLGAQKAEGQSTTYSVGDEDDWRRYIDQAATDSQSGITTTLNITNNFTVNAQEVINANLNIIGNGYTISMGLSSDRLLFIAGGTVSISDITFKNGEAFGGIGTQGGGGGAGLGGAIFVGSGSYATGNGSPAITGLSVPNVTLTNVSLTENTAHGGGAQFVPNSTQPNGGGGGMGGSGGVGTHGVGGGGGFGFFADGGDSTLANATAGGPGAFTNVTGNTSGGSGGGDPSAAGGANGGGGGAGGNGESSVFGTGAGGGVGGGNGSTEINVPGGSGGFAGGGGGATEGNGGAGGFGGGGGGAGNNSGDPGGAGGFGGGGGSSGSTGGAGGFGASRGANTEGAGGGGGGGLGAGGALFVMAGATVTIVQQADGTSNFSNNTVMPGEAYQASFDGSAYGADLFLGANVTFNVQGSGSMSVNSLGGAGNLNDINVTSNNNQNDPNAQGGIIKQGTGTLTLTGTSYYVGQTLVEQGTLTLAAGATETGSSSLVVGTTGNAELILLGNSVITQTNNSSLQPITGSITLGQNNGVQGTLTIGDGENGAGIGYLGITTGSGTGVINFNQATAYDSSSPIYNFFLTISNAITIEQNGIGTTRLAPTSANTYTGGTFVNAGVLQLASGDALPVAGAVTVAGGSFDIDGNNVSLGTLTVSSGSVVDSSGGGSLAPTSIFTQSGTISANLGGSGALTQNGSGITTLIGDNTYSGGTQVLSGVLAVANSLNIGSGAVNVSGGTFRVQGSAALGRTVLLSGGDYDVEMFGGGSLAGMANAQSDFAGGRDTLATLLDGTTSSTTLNTSFAMTSAASNDAIRQSDVYSLSDVLADDTYVLELSAATVDANSILGWLNPDTNMWVNAAESTGALTLTWVQGEYNPTTDNIAGYYGIHGDSVWVVLNQMSGSYAIIPEPDTVMLLAGGTTVIALLARRRFRNS